MVFDFFCKNILHFLDFMAKLILKDIDIFKMFTDVYFTVNAIVPGWMLNVIRKESWRKRGKERTIRQAYRNT